MCGIAGVLLQASLDERVVEADLAVMAATMAHRGPDGSGVWTSDDGRVGFAHRRLSIIDLSASASQPMHDAFGELSIVFNGEIYNHAELRQELEGLGFRRWFTDHSDTEVVLNAFRAWGIGCLDRFRGVFAFGLWDARSRELWLVRDRVGVKPLYYSERNGRMTFASEIKAILKDQRGPRGVDEEALYHYLTFLVTPAPMTLFQGVYKLPQGHWLRIRADGVQELRRWWDVWDAVSPCTDQSEDEIAEQLMLELRRSVEYRKVSDRPVGVFLSGGIDSSVNAALFAEGATVPIKTFTVGYAGYHPSYVNETDHARRVASTLGSEHSDIFLSVDDLLEFLPSMVTHQDEPLADPVCVPLYFVSKLAREKGVVVCQVGEGADELFHGYTAWADQRRIQRWATLLPGPLARKGAALALRAIPGMPPQRIEYAERAARGEPVFWSGAQVFTERQKHRLLAPDVSARLGGLSSFDAIRPLRERFEQTAWEPTTANWMTYVDLSLRLPELLLMRVDKMSMAVGLEARVPFLDHEFVSLVMSIPSKIKIRGSVTKPLLKRAVRGLLADEVINRPKQGFGIPTQDWLSTLMARGGLETMERFSRESGFVNDGAVDGIVRSGNPDRTWVILNLAMWWEQHFGGGLPRNNVSEELS